MLCIIIGSMQQECLGFVSKRMHCFQTFANVFTFQILPHTSYILIPTCTLPPLHRVKYMAKLLVGHRALAKEINLTF